jgi:hypothetical protein
MHEGAEPAQLDRIGVDLVQQGLPLALAFNQRDRTHAPFSLQVVDAETQRMSDAGISARLVPWAVRSAV